MHGIIFSELKRFATVALGPAAWDELLRQAGLPGKSYLASRSYPDQELASLVMTASRVTGIEVPQLLEQFGTFIAPTLLDTYRPYVKKEWRTLDLLEHTEETIHKVVRMKEPGAAPPQLKARRTGPMEVEIEYSSPRRLCAVAEGIAKGVAAHYGDEIIVSQPECMHRGNPRCRIVVRLLRTLSESSRTGQGRTVA